MTTILPRIIGHRGAPRRARENTVAAFLAARDEGADGVELDIHRSRDGMLIVHHDCAIDGFGVLAEHTAAEIAAAYEWLPTLAQVLDAVHGLLVNIEIKNSPKDLDFDSSESAAEEVVALLQGRAEGRGAEGRGDGDEVLVSSFHLPSIERVHALDPAIPTAYLSGAAPAPLDALQLAADGGHCAIHPFFGMLGGAAATDVVDRSHSLGIAVNVWTVNDPEEIVRLATAGVDAIVTDVPAEARAALLA